MEIFNKEQRNRSENLIKNNKVMPLNGLYSSEIQNLAIAWSYYSGKIEGNTYTFVETDTLLKEGITSPKRYEDAKMLKNLYNTFISELEYIKSGKKEVINDALLLRIHYSLAKELISDYEAGTYRKRPVGITGTHYVPPRNQTEIMSKINEILYTQEQITNPMERAVYLHCNIARTKPFIDGNKRTARLIESIILMNEDIIPIFSTEISDVNEYKSALIHFYETEDYSRYADYFLRKKEEYLSVFLEENKEQEEKRSFKRKR